MWKHLIELCIKGSTGVLVPFLPKAFAFACRSGFLLGSLEVTGLVPLEHRKLNDMKSVKVCLFRPELMSNDEFHCDLQ